MNLELANNLIDIIPFPSYIKNQEGRYVYVNIYFSRLIFGREISEVIGKAPSELDFNFTKEELEHFIKADKRAFETEEEQRLETSIKCADQRIHIFRTIKTIRSFNNNKFIFGIMIDFTDNKKIERQLEFEQSLLKIFLDNIPDSVRFKDIYGNYYQINKAESKRLKIESPSQALGKNDKNYFGDDLVKLFNKLDNDVINQKSVMSFEHEITYPQNDRRIMLINKIPLISSNGKVNGICEIMKDITNDKRKDEQKTYLNQFEKVLAKISNYFIMNGPDKFFEALDLMVRDLSDYLYSQRGYAFVYEKEEFVCKSYYEWGKVNDFKEFNINNYNNWLTRLSRHEIIFDDISDCVEDQEPEKKYLTSNQLSHIIILPLINYSVLDGYVIFECKKSNTHWLKNNSSIFIVLTEVINNAFRNYEIEKYRQEVEEEMRKLMRAVDQSANMVLITDKKGNIEYINPKFTEISGYAFEDVIGKKPIILQENSNGSSLSRQIWKTISSGKEWSGKIQNKSKNSNLYWANVTLSPIKNLKGEITNYLGIMEDITEKMVAENRNAISQKLESIGQLAAGIAHEINTPMQYINDNASFLKDAFVSIQKFLKDLESEISVASSDEVNALKSKIQKLKTDLDIDYIVDEIPKAIEQSQVGINRVTNIIIAMKDFAHPGSKDKNYYDINHGIEVTTTISKNEWKYNADIELVLEKNLPDVYCLQDELNQVILNMIINSSHAIQEKFGKESGEKGLIKIETRRENECALISISDNGKGIKPENLNKIFDPFFTTKQVGKGTGQGLAISHDIIVNKHGGQIYVDSKYGMGTKFTIKIPLNKVDDEKS